MTTAPTPDELAATFEASPIGVAFLDDARRMQVVNACLARMLDRSTEELAITTLADITHPGDVAPDEALLDELIAGRRSEYQLRKRLVRRDGTLLWAWQSVRRAQEGRGRVVVMIEDVSAARVAEEKLRGLVHDLGERVKELTALHKTAQLLLLTRGAPETLLGAVAELLPPAMQYPAITTGCIRYGTETYATTGHCTTPWVLDAHFETADGTRGTIEVAYHQARGEAALGPFLAEEATLLASLAEMVRAALDRLAGEAVLTDQRRYIELAFRTAQLGIWDYDVAGGTVRWSPELSYALGLEGEHRGPVWGRAELMHPEDRAHVRARIEAAIRGDDDLRGLSLRMRRADGNYRLFDLTPVIVREPPAQATRILALFADVTERRAKEERLRELERER